MRIVVVIMPVARGERLHSIGKSIASTLSSSGHIVDIRNALLDPDASLTSYDYLIVGTAPKGLFGALDDRVAHYLARCGHVAGKRSCAFVCAHGPGSGRALTRLMKTMESEALIINDFSILRDEADAVNFARTLPLERIRAP